MALLVYVFLLGELVCDFINLQLFDSSHIDPKGEIQDNRNMQLLFHMDATGGIFRFGGILV